MAAMLLAVLAIFLHGRAAAAQEAFRTLGAGEVKTIIEGGMGAAVIDARTEKEYHFGHLPGAVSVPPDKVREIGRYLPKDKGAPVIFYCRGGT
ncbi:MAG: hypothetical protein Kow0025_17230 [Thermodesulfovibrionales bacterium]